MYVRPCDASQQFSGGEDLQVSAVQRVDRGRRYAASRSAAAPDFGHRRTASKSQLSAAALAATAASGRAAAANANRRARFAADASSCDAAHADDSTRSVRGACCAAGCTQPIRSDA